MKLNYLYVLFLFGLVTSCIRDEARNAEADIEFCIIKDKSILGSEADTMYRVGTASNRVRIWNSLGADLSSVVMDFQLTPGATISPEGGVSRDFTMGPLEYIVTSEDGNWSKVYNIGFEVPDIGTEFLFEHYELEPDHKKYYQWFILMRDNVTRQYSWATGNPGYKIARGSAKADNYPSIPYSDGYKGSCVKLETRSTGAFGEMVNMPLAAGNFFLGTFDVTYALTNAMKATKFGVPYARKPLSMSGYYKYKPGENYQDKKGNIIPEKRDECHLYGVFYENTRIVDGELQSVMLDGDDVLTNESIVALAELRNADEVAEWTYFTNPFTYVREVDPVRLANYGYNLAIVFSSSIDGAQFMGAIGSTLFVDEVKLEVED